MFGCLSLSRCMLLCVSRLSYAPTFLFSSGAKDKPPILSPPLFSLHIPSSPVPFLSSPSRPLPFTPPFRCPPHPLEVGPLNTARGSGERCKLPSGVWGDFCHSRQKTWCVLESKSVAAVAAVFVDFPKNKCNFLHESKLNVVRRVQFLTGRRSTRSFSPGAVATIALWKSAPMASVTDEHHRNYHPRSLHAAL